MLHNDTVSNTCSNKSVQRLAWTLAMLVTLVMVAVGCDHNTAAGISDAERLGSIPHQSLLRARRATLEGDTVKLTFP